MESGFLSNKGNGVALGGSSCEATVEYAIDSLLECLTRKTRKTPPNQAVAGFDPSLENFMVLFKPEARGLLVEFENSEPEPRLIRRTRGRGSRKVASRGKRGED